jgi:hypothetical protein
MPAPTLSRDLYSPARTDGVGARDHSTLSGPGGAPRPDGTYLIGCAEGFFFFFIK